MKIKLMVIMILTFIAAQSALSNNMDEKINDLEGKLKSDSDNIEILSELTILYHNYLAGERNPDYMKRAEELFEKLIRLDPKNSEAFAYSGSLLTIKGRDAWMPWNKLKHVEEGLDNLDKGVKCDSQNMTVRLIRANNNLSLPSFFNRIDTSIVDFNYVIKKYKNTNDENIKRLPNLYFKLARAYKKKGNIDKTTEVWNKICEDYPQSEEAKESKQYLFEMKEEND